MDDFRTRLEHDLTEALGRFRQLGGAVALEEPSGAFADCSPCADEVDGILAAETREIGFATRERLMARVNGLSAALDRLNGGDYGVCVECAERIFPARLRAVPEAQTCIRCQDGIERFARRDRNHRPMGRLDTVD